MQYRNFGKIDFKPSALGFGMMRLPVIGGDPALIDEEKAEKMVLHAIKKGVNYFDTAYVYHKGRSEPFLGRILEKNGLRKKVKLATKLPSWLIETAKDFDRILEEQLDNLRTKQIDFYLLHNLNESSWNKIESLGVIEWAEEKASEGKIKNLGFSFHDEYPVFQKIVDSYGKWAFCLLQYNFVDQDIQAGRRGVKYASDKGMGVVVMEPLKGGRLASAPGLVNQVWERAEKKRTPADWALNWLWDQQEVSLVLSGMSNLEQVEENIKSADLSGINILKEEEKQLFEEARLRYRELMPIPCSKCKYCLPCPKGVNIPRVLETYNEAFAYENMEMAKAQYSRFLETEKAANCIGCRGCEKLCPQKIEISKWMKEADKLFG